jgi:triosephosphate isomerase
MSLSMYLTSGEAAQHLSEELHQQVSYYDLDNLIRSVAIDPPKLIGGRRLWSHEDLKNAASALRIRRAKRPVLTSKRSTNKKRGDN